MAHNERCAGRADGRSNPVVSKVQVTELDVALKNDQCEERLVRQPRRRMARGNGGARRCLKLGVTFKMHDVSHFAAVAP